MMTRIGFPEQAEEAFSFLADNGFRIVDRGATGIQYETGRAFVRIEWEPRSGELNVFLGVQPSKGEPSDSFALGDLLGMEGVEAGDGKMPFQVADETRLGPFLKRLAEDTRIHAQPALAGDRMYFHRLKAFRDAQGQAFMRDMKLRRVRSEAEKAWQRQELEKVADLYDSIEDDLTEVERGKLAYARKHQG
jgi:hypothetical protein